jgi:hypothetical protein
MAGKPAMNGFDRQLLLRVLIGLVMALFVASGMAGLRWRRPLRRAAIIGLLIALSVALLEIGLWAADGLP